MDGREQLRRYLEQRKESGERELVLDQLNVEEVLKLVGAVPKTSGSSSDWREVLRGAGAAPETAGGKREAGIESASEKAETALPATRSPAPDMQGAPGLSVGNDDRELFGSAMASLDSLDAVARSVASCTRGPFREMSPAVLRQIHSRRLSAPGFTVCSRWQRRSAGGGGLSRCR